MKKSHGDQRVRNIENCYERQKEKMKNEIFLDRMGIVTIFFIFFSGIDKSQINKSCQMKLYEEISEISRIVSFFLSLARGIHILMIFKKKNHKKLNNL